MDAGHIADKPTGDAVLGVLELHAGRARREGNLVNEASWFLFWVVCWHRLPGRLDVVAGLPAGGPAEDVEAAMNVDHLNEDERTFLGCLLVFCIFATGFTVGVVGALAWFAQ